MPVVSLLERVLETPGGETFLVDVLLGAFAVAGSEETAAIAGWRGVGYPRCGLEGSWQRRRLRLMKGRQESLQAYATGSRWVMRSSLVVLLLVRVVLLGLLRWTLLL